MRRSKIADYCTELTVTNVRLTNDEMINCLLFFDDVTLENGPLEVIQESHKGPLYSHWQNNVFTGATDENMHKYAT